MQLFTDPLKTSWHSVTCDVSKDKTELNAPKIIGACLEQ
jgi:hypothetical protein